MGYFCHFRCFKDILVILNVSWLFWSFFRFRGILVIFRNFEGIFSNFRGFECIFGHFRGFKGFFFKKSFSSILVIIILVLLCVFWLFQWF